MTSRGSLLERYWQMPQRTEKRKKSRNEVEIKILTKLIRFLETVETHALWLH